MIVVSRCFFMEIGLVYIFKHLTDLSSVDPSIRVQVIVVEPRPRLQWRTNNREPATEHDVIRIITKYGRYVLDLTAE